MLGFRDLGQVGVYHTVVDAYALYSFIHIEYIYNTRGIKNRAASAGCERYPKTPDP